MVAIYSAGAGGNYAMLVFFATLFVAIPTLSFGISDATNFLEFLPHRWAFLTTILAIWSAFRLSLPQFC